MHVEIFYYQVFIYKVKVNERMCLLLSQTLKIDYIWCVLCYCHPTLGYPNCYKVVSAPLRPQIRLACSSTASFFGFFEWTWARQRLRHEWEGTVTGRWPWSQGHKYHSKWWKWVGVPSAKFGKPHLTRCFVPDHELPWRARESICFLERQ